MLKPIFPTFSTLVHLRFLYSLYLLPVFLFAISQVVYWNNPGILWGFIILHFFVYPASNGYNSYYDQDEGSIGGVKQPPKVDRSLIITSWFLEIMGALAGFVLYWKFGLGILIYGLFSKLYSHRKTRLKSKPWFSFFIVFFFQGAFIYWITQMIASPVHIFPSLIRTEVLPALFCSFMVGASYILTQIYQHKEDQLRGDITLSALLGYKGTFYFSGICFLTGTVLLGIYFQTNLMPFVYFLWFTLPIMVYFLYWFFMVCRKESNASFERTMLMSTLSFICLSLYFLLLIFLKGF